MEGVHAAEQAVTDGEAGLLHSRIWRGLIFFPGRMWHILGVICPRNFTTLCILSLLRWAGPVQATDKPNGERTDGHIARTRTMVREGPKGPICPVQGPAPVSNLRRGGIGEELDGRRSGGPESQAQKHQRDASMPGTSSGKRGGLERWQSCPREDHGRTSS